MCCQAQDIVSKMLEAAFARQELPEVQRALAGREESGEAVPLLQWLLTDVLKGRAVPGMQHHSASLR